MSRTDPFITAPTQARLRSRVRPRKLAICLAMVVVLDVALWPSSASADSAASTVASGIDNPRGLGFGPDGVLYVAEAGRGGDGPCFPGAEGGEVCFGTTGAVTRIQNGSHNRVLSGLPSFADSEGASAVGPSDVSFSDYTMFVSIGLGADPARRAQLPPTGQEAGWLLRARPSGRHWTPAADIAGFEAEANPDGAQVNSNPNSVTSTAGGQAVADAGGNSLVSVSSAGTVSTLAVFPTQPAATPYPGMDIPFPVESVPTSVVRGPDGAFYVGELTGFPFLPGIARVYRVVPGHELEVFADGFTNIIDLGFADDGTLYVLEIAHNGLLSGDPTGDSVVSMPSLAVIRSYRCVTVSGMTQVPLSGV